MASVSFTAAASVAAAVHLRQSDVASKFGDQQRPSKFIHRKRLALSSNAASSTEPSSAAPDMPEIELEFVGPQPAADGSYPVDKVRAVSGEKLLRNIMNENKIELYATYGKVMNCGGGGSCGTCIVEDEGFLRSGYDIDVHFQSKLGDEDVVGVGEYFGDPYFSYRIIDGKELLNERTDTELRYLKKKPESWRLACQTIVGNKENSGKVAVQRLPQWKK